METRNTKIITGSAGGTASKSSKTYKISIPSKWVKELSLEQKNIVIVFDGKSITIKPKETLNEFISAKQNMGHKLMMIKVFEKDTLRSAICADFTDKTVIHKDYTDNAIKTPFGNNTNPSFEDFEDYLKERCISENRAGLQEYLDVLNLDKFDPIEIIKKTKGIMAEDNFHLEPEELQCQ